jgi:hypothetical protein
MVSRTGLEPQTRLKTGKLLGIYDTPMTPTTERINRQVLYSVVPAGSYRLRGGDPVQSLGRGVIGERDTVDEFDEV